jgi:DNA repair photolyase
MSPSAPGVYGVDLTAGCAHQCVYCPVRNAGRADDLGRLPFDPFTAEGVDAALGEGLADTHTIVLGPLSDPLPPIRQVRAEAVRVAEIVLNRGLKLLILTRGRFPKRLIDLLAAHREQSRVALGLFSHDKALVRRFEPFAASPAGRLRDIARLTDRGVPVEVRLEPLIPDLTDTRDNLIPLFRRLRDAGATQVVVHYMFMHKSVAEPLRAALADAEAAERLSAAFADGPMLTIGSMGTVRNLPRATRQDGLARVMAWGADFGLTVSTGAAQNPDLPQSQPGRSPGSRGAAGAGRVGALRG